MYGKSAAMNADYPSRLQIGVVLFEAEGCGEFSKFIFPLQLLISDIGKGGAPLRWVYGLEIMI